MIDAPAKHQPAKGAAWHQPLLPFMAALLCLVSAASGAAAQNRPTQPQRVDIPPHVLPPGSRYNQQPDTSDAPPPPQGDLLQTDKQNNAAIRPTPATRDDLPQLVADLASPSWPIRELAELRLRAMDASLLAALDPLLQAARDPEVLWRLERVYRSLVPQAEYAPPHELRPGFLGIGFEIVSGDDAANIGQRRHAARITMLVDGAAAERAGLQIGDLLLSIDDEAFVGDFQAQHLQRILVSRGAGRQVRIAILRQNEMMAVQLKLDAPPYDENRRSGPFDDRILEYRWQEYWTSRRAGEVNRQQSPTDTLPNAPPAPATTPAPTPTTAGPVGSTMAPPAGEEN